MIVLTHWGRVTHICVSKLTIIGSDNGLSPNRRKAIIWTNAGLLSIGPLGTNFAEILIEILTFSFKKMRLNVSSAKQCPFCLGLNVLKMKSKHQIMKIAYWNKMDLSGNNNCVQHTMPSNTVTSPLLTLLYIEELADHLLETYWVEHFLTLYMLNFSEGTKTYIYFYVIPPHWHDTGSWNPSSSKTRTYLFYIVNINIKEPGHQ